MPLYVWRVLYIWKRIVEREKKSGERKKRMVVGRGDLVLLSSMRFGRRVLSLLCTDLSLTDKYVYLYMTFKVISDKWAYLSLRVVVEREELVLRISICGFKSSWIFSLGYGLQSSVSFFGAYCRCPYGHLILSRDILSLSNLVV